MKKAESHEIDCPTCNETRAEAKTLEGNLSVNSWPADVIGGALKPGGVYECTPQDDIISGDVFEIPDNFTIKFHKDLRIVYWRFKRLRFGKNCTIDLTPAAGKPPKPPKAADGPNFPQPSWGLPGANGSDGQTGIPGLDGVVLNLAIGTWDLNGSLWIRTDGGEGGDGGDGGNGGLGGGWSCGPMWREEPWTNGGQGGTGGHGGISGCGGASARVDFRIMSVPEGAVLPGAVCLPECGPSHRPRLAEGGSIVISGRPGCPGKPGKGGKGGHGGDGPVTRKKSCGWFSEGVHGGADGPDGKDGENSPGFDRCLRGDLGRCSEVTIRIDDPAQGAYKLISARVLDTAEVQEFFAKEIGYKT